MLLTKKKLSLREMVFAAFCTALMAVCSWICIPGPVPFTLQTFAIFLCCDLLGGPLAFLSILVYLLLGAAGVPVFAEFRSGVGTLLGPTGGYIMGFLFSALLLTLWQSFFGRRMRALAMALSLCVCYLLGTVWFVLVYARSGQPMSFGAALGFCVLPYIIPDGIKIFLACLLSDRLRKALRLKGV